ncbi:MAG: type II CAAX endopeptidase family protein [Vicingaceae bacterium]
MKVKSYPSLAQSWGIVGIAILANIVFIPLNSWLTEVSNKEVAMLIYYLFGMGTPLLFAHFLRKKESGRSSFQWKKPKAFDLVLIIIALLGLQLGFTMPIANLIPMPEVVKQMFLELAQMDGIAGFLTIVVAAPFLEEMIFRGIIFDGMAKKYSVTKAILWSSFLFGVVHLNPWQFISAMTIGCFAAWLYYRTKNLSLCVIVHFVNNGLAFFSMQFFEPEKVMDISMIELYGSAFNATLVIAASLFLALLMIYLLNKKLPHAMKHKTSIEENAELNS